MTCRCRMQCVWFMFLTHFCADKAFRIRHVALSQLFAFDSGNCDEKQMQGWICQLTNWLGSPGRVQWLMISIGKKNMYTSWEHWQADSNHMLRPRWDVHSCRGPAIFHNITLAEPGSKTSSKPLDAASTRPFLSSAQFSTLCGPLDYCLCMSNSIQKLSQLRCALLAHGYCSHSC